MVFGLTETLGWDLVGVRAGVEGQDDNPTHTSI